MWQATVVRKSTASNQAVKVLHKVYSASEPSMRYNKVKPKISKIRALLKSYLPHGGLPESMGGVLHT
jgi:hypothetical protein